MNLELYSNKTPIVSLRWAFVVELIFKRDIFLFFCSTLSNIDIVEEWTIWQ